MLGHQLAKVKAREVIGQAIDKLPKKFNFDSTQVALAFLERLGEERVCILKIITCVVIRRSIRF